MIIDFKELKYKNKRVFEKLVMTIDFKREQKYFTDKEACFLFLKNGSFQFRTPTQVITYFKNEAMLAKCGDYFIEPANKIDKKNREMRYGSSISVCGEAVLSVQSQGPVIGIYRLM